MRMWQILIPIETDLFLKSLKSLALFEFLPTETVDDTIKDWLGIESDPDDMEP